MAEAQIHVKYSKLGEKIYYSLTEKQSQKKFFFNERLFVLVQQKYLGYIHEYNKKDLDGSCDVNKIKKKIPIKDIRRILNINNEITLMINQYDKSNKLKSLKWLFRMSTQKLAQSWTQILERQNSPFPSRKTTQQRTEQQLQFSPVLKNPSIKQLIKDAETISKQKDNQVEANKKVSQRQITNIQDKEGQISNLQRQDDSEATKRTFSFRGQKQDEFDVFSPTKRQSKAALMNSVTKKARSLEEELSSTLQKNINMKIVEHQLNQHKSRIKTQNLLQFRQLSQNLTNKQKQLQNINFTNYFRQRMGQINDQLFQDFYCFCEIKIKQLLLQDFQNQFSTKNWIKYVNQHNGVNVQILPSDLKQIPGNSNICDEGLLKTYLNKAKNLDYLWKIITNDEGLSQIFKISMSCIVEYQGVLAYFTCNYKIENSMYSSKNQDFSYYFELLAEKLKINKIVFQNPNLIKFIKISNKQFLISEVGQFLPRIASINAMIRPEMFSQISNEVLQQQKGYLSKAGKRQQQQQNRYFKQNINQAISVLSKNLDRLQQYVIHPSQFSQLMHLYGLNIAYLNQIQKKVENSFIRTILKTQAALRSFKTIYRKKMQEHLLHIQQDNNTKKQLLNFNALTKMTKSLLNILLSRSQQSELLWEVVALHSRVNFKMAFNKNQLNKGYLFLGLELHLGVKLNTTYNNCEKIFTADSFINTVQFVPKIKPCQLFWINQQIYNLQYSKTADELIRVLKLKQKQIPFYVYQNKSIRQKIYDIISLYYAPINPMIKHLKIYQELKDSFDLTLYFCRRKMAEIKWIIKIQSQQTNSLDINRVQQKLIKLKQLLIFYFGSYHPFYNQIYDLLISINEKQRNYEKVLQYLKVSMTNMIQLCGGNTMHLRLANNYYQKAEFYQGWGKSEQAIANYKKAKNILQFNSYTSARQYAMIQLKLAILYLSKYKDIDSYKQLKSCLVAFSTMAKIPLEDKKKQSSQQGSRIVSQNMQNISQNISYNQNEDSIQILAQQQIQNYTNIVISLQLMNRCNISDPSRISTIIQSSLIILSNCISPQYPFNPTCLPDNLTSRLIKLLVQNYFDQHKREISKDLVNYMQAICDQIHVVNARFVDPNNALASVKQLIINNLLINTLADFKTKSQMCMKLQNTNPVLNTNKVNKDIENFQLLIKSMLIILGEGFMLGMLNQKIK